MPRLVLNNIVYILQIADARIFIYGINKKMILGALAQLFPEKMIHFESNSQVKCFETKKRFFFTKTRKKRKNKFFRIHLKVIRDNKCDNMGKSKKT